MAYFLVRNSLNPGVAYTFGITTKQYTPKDNEGEPVWVMEIATEAPAVGGGTPYPEIIYLTSVSGVPISGNSLDEEISDAVANLSGRVDWGALADDNREPYIDSISPTSYSTSIDSNVEVNIKDLLPSAGINFNKIKIYVNGFDVTSEISITGDPYDCTVKWSPPQRIYSTFT